MSSSTSSSGGTSFTTLLQILFIGLKLGGVINWPWIWVLSPLWIGALLVVGFLILFVILSIISGK